MGLCCNSDATITLKYTSRLVPVIYSRRHYSANFKSASYQVGLCNYKINSKHSGLSFHVCSAILYLYVVLIVLSITFGGEMCF